MYLELRFVGERFPHLCPRIACAICRWLATQKIFERRSKRYESKERSKWKP